MIQLHYCVLTFSFQGISNTGLQFKNSPNQQTNNQYSRSNILYVYSVYKSVKLISDRVFICVYLSFSCSLAYCNTFVSIQCMFLCNLLSVLGEDGHTWNKNEIFIK